MDMIKIGTMHDIVMHDRLAVICKTIDIYICCGPIIDIVQREELTLEERWQWIIKHCLWYINIFIGHKKYKCITTYIGIVVYIA